MTGNDATGAVLAVIPARWGSTRFPGKPLALVHGKPMIQCVWERVRQARGVDRVIIATDDARILEAATAFGADARMTRVDHASGTDRAWEVAQTLAGYDWILNVQGDEPQIDPAHLEAALKARARWPQADIITLASPIAACQRDSITSDPNIVKVVLRGDGEALYFSRAPIPWRRDPQDAASPIGPQALSQAGLRHLGLYLYRREALARFTQWPPSVLEGIEKLEQLRALENGLRVYVETVDRPAIGVDTPEDLAALLASG
ncbi:MAG: 3-deoxy-manno-octulosonate cytidylyltransferase [Vampirovibrionales bacterium]|nr:3-deoxy-manno-octulosonate cytidylyltransferase [Vampirovibrionales bacterium]